MVKKVVGKGRVATRVGLSGGGRKTLSDNQAVNNMFQIKDRKGSKRRGMAPAFQMLCPPVPKIPWASKPQCPYSHYAMKTFYRYIRGGEGRVGL